MQTAVRSGHGVGGEVQGAADPSDKKEMGVPFLHQIMADRNGDAKESMKNLSDSLTSLSTVLSPILHFNVLLHTTPFQWVFLM